MKFLIVIMTSLILMSCGDSNGSGKKKVNFTPGLTNGESIQSETLIANNWCNTERYYNENDVLINEFTKYEFNSNATVFMTVTENGQRSNFSGQWSYDGTYLKLKEKGRSKVFKTKVTIFESELRMINAIEMEDERGRITFEDSIYNPCN